MPTLYCPICHRDFEVERFEDATYRPFCSKRCEMIDLGRWLDGTYRISESVKPPEEEQEPPASEL